MSFGEGPIPGVTLFPAFTGKGNDLRVDVNLGHMAGLSGMPASHLRGEDPHGYMRAEDILAQAICDGADPIQYGFSPEQVAWGKAMKRMGLLDCTQPYPVWIKAAEAPVPPPPLNPWKQGWYRPDALESKQPVVTAGQDPSTLRYGDPEIEKRTVVSDPDSLDVIFGTKTAPAAPSPIPWKTVAAVAGVGLLAYLVLGRKK